jgi:hypothetical protein
MNDRLNSKTPGNPKIATLLSEAMPSGNVEQKLFLSSLRLNTANTCFEFSGKRGTQILPTLGSIQEG